MEKIPIGEVILKLRKEKGITQDQLANFIGISTAAVSKWESQISYPDITLLPVLATFFNVTIDTLLNFKIDLSEDEVNKIFSECESIFSSGNLEKAMQKSKNYVIKYPHSYYLKVRVGFLFSVYSWKSSNEEIHRKHIGYSIELFEDVAQNCSKDELVQQALFQLGALYSSIGEEDKAVEALSKIHKSQLDSNSILANIYIQKGELKKARQLLQSSLYKNINEMSFACLALADSYMKDKMDLNMVERYYNLIIGIKQTFSLDTNSELTLFTEYLSFVEIYLKFNHVNKAIEMLNKMVKNIRNNDINKLKKVSSVWCFNEIQEGKSTITMNLYENIFKIFEQPLFDLIREKKEFITVVKDLKELEKKSLSSK